VGYISVRVRCQTCTYLKRGPIVNFVRLKTYCVSYIHYTQYTCIVIHWLTLSIDGFKYTFTIIEHLHIYMRLELLSTL